MDNSLLELFLQKKGYQRPKPNEHTNLFKTLHLHPQAVLSVQAHLINVILFPHWLSQARCSQQQGRQHIYSSQAFLANQMHEAWNITSNL